MFAATKLQVITYLAGVCPFSIAFLVFLNSAVSFVITDLIGQQERVGSAVGNLGFADELLALVACPLWGLLSDRIGVRYVCVAGYFIICIALIVFVQAGNVYPQLLLARLFFSVGAAAASTMVTAVLPTVSQGLTNSSSSNPEPTSNVRSHAPSASLTSELTITPARFRSNAKKPSGTGVTSSYVSTARIAGLVGMFTGGGALLALLVFLPLPARFQALGKSPEESLRLSFYVVAAIAFILVVWCFIGLRSLQYESDRNDEAEVSKQPRVLISNLRTALGAGFKNRDIALGYLGGFVARASSVAISLFIPLLVNAMFLKSDLCKNESGQSEGLPDIKRRCPRAYTLAAELTGVSQMVALITAPIFGYLASKSSRRGLPLMVASAAGIIGYPLFANQFSPDDEEKGKRAVSFIAVCLIGISQIGAIVNSLGVLSSGVLTEMHQPVQAQASVSDSIPEERAPLLADTSITKFDDSLLSVKGSIAGIYSFYGGAAILILTKAGGSMFDRVSLGAPFYIMAIFNAILFVSSAVLGLHKQDSGSV